MATLTRKNFKNFKRRVCNRPVTPNLACPWGPRVVPSPARKNFKNFKNFHRSQGKYEGWRGQSRSKGEDPPPLEVVVLLEVVIYHCTDRASDTRNFNKFKNFKRLAAAALSSGRPVSRWQLAHQSGRGS